MPRYLLSIYQPDGPPPAPPALERIMRAVSAVRTEMTHAGVLVLTAGLRPARSAAVVRLPAGGAVVVTDGPFMETKEHLGGFSILDVPDRTAAVGWAGKLAAATTLPIEVREIAGGENAGGDSP